MSKAWSLSLVILPLFAACAANPLVSVAPGTDAADPFLWLEEVEGERALAWVEERNAATLAELSAHPLFQPTFERSLQIMDSPARIAYPSIRGDWLYNFWTDERNPRGIWRRASWDAYLTGEPDWQVLLDIDSLSAAENVTWAWGGSGCLPPEYRRCLVSLSRGGADAVEIREFDTETRSFLDEGFFLPEAKQDVAWVDRDRMLVATDFGEGTLTTSGYPRIAKLWRRGTPLETATTLFAGRVDEVSVGVGTQRTADRDYHFVIHYISFFERAVHVLDGDRLVALDLPLDADHRFLRDQLVVYLRSAWAAGGRSYAAGTVISIPFERFAAGSRDFQVVLQPDARSTVESTAVTRDHLLVHLLNNVRSELWRYGLEDGRWTRERVPTPEFGRVMLIATAPKTNRYFFASMGFTEPTTLFLADAAGGTREVRRMPEMFEAQGLAVEQLEARSRDGTRVPYFLVSPRDVRRDGSNPTLLYGYGGFEVAELPRYSPVLGAAWLERGGVFVIANTRGGGEFGPVWHRAAQKEKRQRAFDDFIAVAEDLVSRGITSAERLGIMGGSNGGLLVGAAVTQRPELFGAAVIQVPLLDMQRYHLLLAGASWIGEYGNPDVPEEWAYIREYSPYHNLRADVRYPRVLFTTTTRDDRVHPGHARKMAARMEALGHPVYYFENTEGGHGSGVTTEQRARMVAVEYTYLWKQLGGDGQTGEAGSAASES